MATHATLLRRIKKNVTPNPDPLTVTTVGPSTPVAKTLYEDSIVKMWVSKTGTGTPAISDDLNVSSITDVGVGDYTPVFATNFSSTHYGVGVIGLRVSGGPGEVASISERLAAVGSYRVQCRDADDGIEDQEFRVLAVGNN